MTSMLSSVQKMYTREQKSSEFGGNPSTNQVVFNLDDIPYLARNLEPKKWNVVSVVERFYDPLIFCLPLSHSSRYSSRSYVNPSWQGNY